MNKNFASIIDFRKDSYTNAGTSLSFFEWIQDIDYDTLSDISLLLIDLL